MAPQPRTRSLTVIAHDPSLRDKKGNVVFEQVVVPAEDLAPGPRGYRVHVIDYDSSTDTLYQPLEYPPAKENGTYADPFARTAGSNSSSALLQDPQFHQQN